MKAVNYAKPKIAESNSILAAIQSGVKGFFLILEWVSPDPSLLSNGAYEADE